MASIAGLERYVHGSGDCAVWVGEGAQRSFYRLKSVRFQPLLDLVQIEIEGGRENAEGRTLTISDQAMSGALLHSGDPVMLRDITGRSVVLAPMEKPLSLEFVGCIFFVLALSLSLSGPLSFT